MPSEHPLQSRVKSTVPNTCVIMIVMYHSSSTYHYYDFMSSLITREFSSCFFDILQRILPFDVLDLAALVVSYGLVLQDCVQLNQYKLKDEIGKVRCILCMHTARVCFEPLTVFLFPVRARMASSSWPTMRMTTRTT